MRSVKRRSTSVTFGVVIVSVITMILTATSLAGQYTNSSTGHAVTITGDTVHVTGPGINKIIDLPDLPELLEDGSEDPGNPIPWEHWFELFENFLREPPDRINLKPDYQGMPGAYPPAPFRPTDKELKEISGDDEQTGGIFLVGYLYNGEHPDDPNENWGLRLAWKYEYDAELENWVLRPWLIIEIDSPSGHIDVEVPLGPGQTVSV